MRALAVAAREAGDIVADDVLKLVVRAYEGGVGGAVEGEGGFAEGDGDMQGAGVVADDERRAGEEGDHFGEGGLAGKVEEGRGC